MAPTRGAAGARKTRARARPKASQADERSQSFLIYGANGFLGEAIARLAVARGMRPIIAGRNAEGIARLAAELGLEHLAFGLDDADAVDNALGRVAVVLHCAGPYVHTWQAMAGACLRTGTHYLDLTGELPVFEALAALDGEAREAGVMLLPGVGFDVVPTDCLAVHLRRRLPAATRLTLAFQSRGPAGLPPGTQRTMIELLPSGIRVRRNGELVAPGRGEGTRLVDFGRGPVNTALVPWGDVFTAWYSTGIPHITDYMAMPAYLRLPLAGARLLTPLLRMAPVRDLLKKAVLPGPAAWARARTRTHVYGEVEDARGRRAAARLHGPEAGVEWTSETALGAVAKVLAGTAPPGFQTPGLAFGPDFVLECGEVQREDLPEQG
ncbi:MAG: saccharopine dehydrogenase NADP-binding domain-containing protein [Rhodocyclaceae bacterium]|nr:saccharopine dehydrogenase NADP-binding domain-containing protein [Rhodocyclaceae bacterium]